jgi:hypothetical protein
MRACHAIVVLLFLGFLLPLFAEDGTAARVATVRIFIGEAKYDWTERGIVLDSTSGEGRETPHLKPETIRSFLSVRPGLAIGANDLARRCRDSERRLRESGYVYDASVDSVAVEGGTMVVVSVTEGFFGRYGGGGYWAMVGRDALFGDRASLRVYGGYNRNGLSIMHHDVAGTPFALGGNLFWYGPGDYDGKTEGGGSGRFFGALTAGRYLSSDLFVGVDAARDGFGPDSSGLFSLQGYSRLTRFVELGAGSDWTGEARGFWYPDLAMTKGKLDWVFHLRPSKKTCLALSASVGRATSDLPVDAGFDLYYAEDRSVRSGYRVADLLANRYALVSAEARRELLSFRVPPAFPCSVEGFAFADLARVDPVLGEGRGEPLDAYGLGARVLFDNPVFAYFTFTYGVNREGDGRFIFCGTAGY